MASRAQMLAHSAMLFDEWQRKNEAHPITSEMIEAWDMAIDLMVDAYADD